MISAPSETPAQKAAAGGQLPTEKMSLGEQAGRLHRLQRVMPCAPGQTDAAAIYCLLLHTNEPSKQNALMMNLHRDIRSKGGSLVAL